MLLFALGTFFTIMSNLFVIGEAEFFAHKQKMEKMYGPCEWKYVGKQTDIKNPALTLNPPVGESCDTALRDCQDLDMKEFWLKTKLLVTEKYQKLCSLD